MYARLKKSLKYSKNMEKEEIEEIKYATHISLFSNPQIIVMHIENF